MTTRKEKSKESNPLTRAEVVQLFDKLTCVPYDLDPQGWDQALMLLDLDLRVQPAIGQILREGRWRRANVANPKAYVASAAWKKALHDNLIGTREYVERLGRKRGELSISESPGQRDDLGKHPLHDERIDELDAAYSRPYVGTDESMYEDLQARIPDELLGDDPDSVTGIDWTKTLAPVADRAVTRPALIAVMQAKESGVSREDLARAAGPEGGRALNAGWKWVGRNLQSKIAPLFQANPRREPESKRIPKGRRLSAKELPPATALMAAIERDLVFNGRLSPRLRDED